MITAGAYLRNFYVFFGDAHLHQLSLIRLPQVEKTFILRYHRAHVPFINITITSYFADYFSAHLVTARANGGAYAHVNILW